jgi:galactose oxidase
MLVFSLGLAASVLATRAVAVGLPIPYKAPSEEVLNGEGVNSSVLGTVNYAASPTGWALGNRPSWGCVVDSEQSGNGCWNAFDGNDATIWHTEWKPYEAPLPHTFTIDMKAVHNVDGLTYRPRQDGILNGNIGQHQIFTSLDGVNFQLVAYGTWFDDATEKASAWETLPARYVRIHAITEAGNRGPWTSASEIFVYAADSYSPTPAGLGKWGPTINFPLVPVAASLEADSWNVVTWSSYNYATYVGPTGGKTQTATWSPVTNVVSELMVTNTDHDMFCPGLSLDFNGRSMVTGGNNAQRTSIYDPREQVWISGPNMKIPRAYQASATLSDGRTFVIGGSWNGGQGGKNGEVYDPATNSWSLLPGCPVAPMLTNDAQGVYRADNHGWLFGWENGCVFQAGPSKAMNWYCAGGGGGHLSVGTRANDPDSMCGNAVMYDAGNGKILTMGGSPNYQGSEASSNAHIITIEHPGGTPSVKTVANMAYQRIFANAVVLPNGEVFVTGGQSFGNPFSDANSILTPEMWNPETETFTKMAPNTIPRNYHSFALLMIDGTVLSGGGGLCGTCSTNHFDAQIYTPPYLLNGNGSPATRPVILGISSNTVSLEQSITMTFNMPIASMSMVRYGSATHTVDTDQRRFALNIEEVGGNTYKFYIPSDDGIMMPGYWMVFGMNSAGVPSVSRTILLSI